MSRLHEFLEDSTGRFSSMRLFLLVMVFVVAFVIVWNTVKLLGWMTATEIVSIIGIIFGGKLVQKKIEGKE